MVNTLTQT